MRERFEYDVFLCYGPEYRLVVQLLSEMLRDDRPGDFSFRFPASGFGFLLLATCLSANGVGSDWSQLETATCVRNNWSFDAHPNQGF